MRLQTLNVLIKRKYFVGFYVLTNRVTQMRIASE